LAHIEGEDAMKGKRGSFFVKLCSICFTAVCGLVMAGTAAAQNAADYSGKTIRIAVGTSSGGGFDTITRILVQYLPAHLPGQPIIIVQNMPGGSSLKAANYIYSAAPADGTYLGVFNHSLILQTVVDPRSAQFEIDKFRWVGRMAIDDLVGIVWHAAGVKTIEDAKKREVIIGANSGNSTSAMVPRALNNLLGTKFKIVTGYPGLAERYLAMERGEIHGISGASWSYINNTRPEWIRESRVVLLHQNSLERSAELGSIPTLVEFARNDEDRKILHLLGLTETIGKSIALGPRVQEVHVRALRAAFDLAVREPGYAQEASRRGLIPETMPGEKLQALFENVPSSMTESFVERFVKVTSESKE
jgi:tripartite-type tricarboxylate transporter receptor subunit TctC